MALTSGGLLAAVFLAPPRVPASDQEMRLMMEQGALYSAIDRTVAKSKSQAALSDAEVVFLFASYDVVMTVTGIVRHTVVESLGFTSDRKLVERMRALAQTGPYRAVTYARYLAKSSSLEVSPNVIHKLLPIAERDKEGAAWVAYWKARGIKDDRRRLAALWKAMPAPGRTTWELEWNFDVGSVSYKLRDGASMRRKLAYTEDQHKLYPRNEVFEALAKTIPEWKKVDWVKDAPG